MISRPKNWPTLLRQFLAERMNKPFEWGKNDCVLTAADWLVVLGHPDPIPDLRGKWDSPLSAARLTKNTGGLLETVNLRLRDLGYLPVHPRMSQRGDIGFVREPEPTSRRLLGIWDTGCLYCPGPRGLVRVPAFGATHSWRI